MWCGVQDEVRHVGRPSRNNKGSELRWQLVLCSWVVVVGNFEDSLMGLSVRIVKSLIFFATQL